MDHQSASSLLRAVADPARLRLLHLLHTEELSVGELVRVLELPQSSVSRHLKSLREEGLVIDRASGPATYYRAALQTGLANGQGGIRQALAGILPPDQLPSADRRKLDRVLALRAAEQGQFFDRIGLQWDALRESCFGASFHLEAFLTLLPREWTVADLGTGTGYLLPHLARHFDRVIAVDISSAMLQQAERRITPGDNLTQIEFHEGRLEQLPLKPASVDLCLAILMLHHLDNLDQAVPELARVTRKGGQVLIVDFEPHTNAAFQLRMADERPGINPRELSDKLKAAGFTDITQHALGQPTLPDHELAPLPCLYAITAKLGDDTTTNLKAAAQRPKSHAPKTIGRKPQ